MATQVVAPGEVKSFEANGDLSGFIYTVMYMTSTAERVDLATQPSSRDQVPVGVLQNKPAAAGRTAQVKTAGICIVKAGAAVTAGRPLTFDSSGRAIHQSSAGQYNIGYAITAAGAAAEEFTMMWVGPTLTNSF